VQIVGSGASGLKPAQVWSGPRSICARDRLTRTGWEAPPPPPPPLLLPVAWTTGRPRADIARVRAGGVRARILFSGAGGWNAPVHVCSLPKMQPRVGVNTQPTTPKATRDGHHATDDMQLISQLRSGRRQKHACERRRATRHGPLSSWPPPPAPYQATRQLKQVRAGVRVRNRRALRSRRQRAT
jgi:hypothetical protein